MKPKLKYSPTEYWDFIEKYYPLYYSCDDVSMCTLTPADMLLGSSRLLANGMLQGRFEQGIGHFSWGVELSGRKIAECEMPPLANKFLQYLGIDQNICQIVFLIVSEMVSNAIDHGILRLDSAVKEQADGFEFYFQERERRLKLLTEQDVISLSLEWLPQPGNPALAITVRDSGVGYDPSVLRAHNDDQLSGRGLHLIRSLARSAQTCAPRSSRLRLWALSITPPLTAIRPMKNCAPAPMRRRAKRRAPTPNQRARRNSTRDGVMTARWSAPRPRHARRPAAAILRPRLSPKALPVSLAPLQGKPSCVGFWAVCFVSVKSPRSRDFRGVSCFRLNFHPAII